MTSFDRAIQFVLESEGGISEDPNDPGGLTRWGISSRQYPGIDIRKLTREGAIELYHRDYWMPIHGDALPPQVSLILMDAAVNQGVSTAIRMLQNALGVKADGVVGPLTLGAVASSDLTKLINEFVARRAYAYGLTPAFMRFGLGWSRRLAKCHQLSMENL